MFKRLILTLTLVALLATPVFAYDVRKSVEPAVSSDSSTAINVPLTNTIYTKAISMRNNRTSEDVGIMLKATSDGTITLQVDLEQGYAKPATEGSEDSNYITTDTISWAGTTTSGNTSISDTYWKIATVETVVMPYIRFKIIGSGSNDRDTEVEMKVIK